MQINNQTILVGDCLDHMRNMEPNSIDIIVSSPPYNLGISYNQYDDNKPRDVYLDWLKLVAKEFSKVLKDDGSIFLNIGSTNIDPWLQMDVANVFRELFLLQNHIVWAKSLSVDDLTFGHFKPINSKRFLNHNHEAIFHFSKFGNVPLDRLAIGVPYMDKSNISRRNHQQDKRCAGNIWYIPYKTVQSKSQKYNHPAGYPVELVIRCLKLHGKKGVVLDPFMGTGTTLAAAAEYGCSGIGIEIDSSYADIAYERLKNG